MVEVALSKRSQKWKGMVAWVDERDYLLVSSYSWHAQEKRSTFYAATRVAHPASPGRTTLRMHRLILGLEFGDGRLIDHIDGNGLNNQRSNLRIATNSQNQMNRGSQRGSSSRFAGVSFHKQSGRWQARITCDARLQHLGLHKTEEEAALAYNQAALAVHGEFARLNTIGENR